MNHVFFISIITVIFISYSNYEEALNTTPKNNEIVLEESHYTTNLNVGLSEESQEIYEGIYEYNDIEINTWTRMSADKFKFSLSDSLGGEWSEEVVKSNYITEVDNESNTILVSKGLFNVEAQYGRIIEYVEQYSESKYDLVYTRHENKIYCTAKEYTEFGYEQVNYIYQLNNEDGIFYIYDIIDYENHEDKNLVEEYYRKIYEKYSVKIDDNGSKTLSLLNQDNYVIASGTIENGQCSIFADGSNRYSAWIFSFDDSICMLDYSDGSPFHQIKLRIYFKRVSHLTTAST